MRMRISNFNLGHTQSSRMWQWLCCNFLSVMYKKVVKESREKVYSIKRRCPKLPVKWRRTQSYYGISKQRLVGSCNCYRITALWLLFPDRGAPCA